MAGWQDDQVVAPATKGASWQNDPVVGGAPSAQASSDLDYSKSPLSAVARTFESSADWGTGDLIRAAMTGKKPSQTAAQSSAAAASLPWYVRYPTEAAGYGLGLVNLLDPVTDAAEAGAAALGAGKTLSGIAGTAAEGATVGGVSHIAGSDDPTLTGTAGAALGGAALGGALGAAGPLVNKGLTKILGKAASVDPVAAQAKTAAESDAIYKAGRDIPINPTATNNAISGVFKGLDPSQQTGLSDGFQKQVDNIQGMIGNLDAQGKDLNANQINSWKRQIKDAASPGIEAGVAKQIGDGLDGVLQAHPGVGPWQTAGDWQDAANKAYQQSQMAENLAKFQRTVQAGGNLGQAPLTEAERFYDPSSPEYQTLAGLANQGQGPSHATYAMGHLGANALGALGGMIGGWPGSFVGEGLGYMYARPAIYKAMKGVDQRGRVKNIQAAYPQMTGQPLTGATAGPQVPQGVGDSLKNLLLGATY